MSKNQNQIYFPRQENYYSTQVVRPTPHIQNQSPQKSFFADHLINEFTPSNQSIMYDDQVQQYQKKNCSYSYQQKSQSNIQNFSEQSFMYQATYKNDLTMYLRKKHELEEKFVPHHNQRLSSVPQQQNIAQDKVYQYFDQDLQNKVNSKHEIPLLDLNIRNESIFQQQREMEEKQRNQVFLLPEYQKNQKDKNKFLAPKQQMLLDTQKKIPAKQHIPLKQSLTPGNTISNQIKNDDNQFLKPKQLTDLKKQSTCDNLQFEYQIHQKYNNNQQTKRNIFDQPNYQNIQFPFHFYLYDQTKIQTLNQTHKRQLSANITINQAIQSDFDMQYQIKVSPPQIDKKPNNIFQNYTDTHPNQAQKSQFTANNKFEISH